MTTRTVNVLISPCKMLDANCREYGNMYQMMYRGMPQDIYFMTLGDGEKSVLRFEKNDEGEVVISTQNRTSLKEYISQYRVLLTNKKLSIG